jgi:uncharacterized protein (DUF1697 family)
MKRWAALLKGINVGGNRKLPMAELRDFAETLGFANVRTLLASGNLVFDAEKTSAAALEARLEAEAEERLGLRTEFLLRDGAAMDAVIAANPFPQQARERPGHLLVHFFQRTAPAPAWLAAIDADNAGPEQLVVAGRELFVDYADGIGTSVLPPLMAKAKYRALAGDTGVNTARNWNTVLKLGAMLAPD